MLRAIIPALAMSLILPSIAESAEERAVGADARTSLGLVIYGGGFAMVRDQRKVDLAEGNNRIALTDVSRSMDQASTILRAENATVTAQLFDFDILTPDRLLAASVGQDVTIISTHPQTGVETLRRARVLSVSGGPVLQIDGRIETGIPGRLAFDALPPGVRSAPSMVADIQTETPGERVLDLAYLTDNLDWQADYVAEIAPDGSSLRLESWATLTNRTDIDFTNANISLVSGQVNRQPTRQPKAAPMLMRSEAMAVSDSAGGAPVREGLGDYHLYRLKTPVTLSQRESRKIALFSPAAVQSSRTYLFRGGQHYYGGRSGEQQLNAAIEIHFVNDPKAGLGEPLPGGTVRLYQRDSTGTPVFIGEDSIARTPENQEVRLNIGQAFDVTATRRQTDYDRRKDSIGTVTTTEHEIVVANAREDAVTVRIEERLYGDWEILSSSAEYEKLDAFRLAWDVTVPAGGETTLSWKARIR